MHQMPWLVLLLAMSSRPQRHIREQGSQGIQLIQHTATGRMLQLHALYETPCFYMFPLGRLAKHSKHYTLTRI